MDKVVLFLGTIGLGKWCIRCAMLGFVNWSTLLKEEEKYDG